MNPKQCLTYPVEINVSEVNLLLINAPNTHWLAGHSGLTIEN